MTTAARVVGILRDPGTLLRAFVLGASLVAIGLFLRVVTSRLAIPLENEWMTGAVLDHVAQVIAGRPLYAAPSASFIPFLYPPLYYWLSAKVAAFAPLVLACRAVSLASTCVSAGCVARLSRLLGASAFWCTVAVGLFFGAYSFTEYWYDLERCDPLFVAMVVVGSVVALESRSLAAAAVGGAIVAGSFFAKQPGAVFFAAGIVGFAAALQGRRAIAFALGGLAILAPCVLGLSRATGGWFIYYCVRMPLSHGIRPQLLRHFAAGDLSNGFLLTAATVLVLASAAVAVWRARKGSPPDPTSVFFASQLAAGLVTAGTSRLHTGGWPNVLMFWSTFACVAVAACATRLEQAAVDTRIPGVSLGTRLALAGAVLLQLARMVFDPTDASPGPRHVRSAEALAQVTRVLETHGEVVMHGRGHVTRVPHYHVAALVDVLRMGDPIPPDLREGLASQRFAAFIVNDFDELSLEGLLPQRSELADLVLANYYVAVRLDEDQPPPVIGWQGHPQWILRPRHDRLTDASGPALARRRTLEMGIAEMKMRARTAGGQSAIVDLGDDVEELAAREDARLR